MAVLKISGLDVLVDDQDVELVSDRNWSVSTGRTGKPGGVLEQKHLMWMHRLILDPPLGVLVDHVNRNPLDNRRCNLRLCTLSENQWNKGRQANNTSGYKGVHFNSRDNVWRAAIRVHGKRRHLGSFRTAEEAGRAYAAAARALHGEFSCIA